MRVQKNTLNRVDWVKLFPTYVLYFRHLNLTDGAELLLKTALLNIVIELKDATAPPAFINF